MPTNFAFLLSMYLTLVLGTVTLGYSEFEYLPEVTGFTGVVVVLTIVAFAMDLRGRHLTLANANNLGVAIFVVTATWVYLHYRQADSLLHTLPWPAGGLPYLAPLLMVLVPAKLFRPKHIGDWWALQGMCLCGVGLAVSLAEDVFCVLLVLAYAVCAVWSLTLFYLFRAAGKVEPYPVKPLAKGWRSWLHPAYWFPLLQPAPDTATLAAAFEGIGPPTAAERLGRSHFTRSLRWMVVAGLLAAPLFFLLPRSAGVPWELFAVRLETGYSADSAPDLSRTGVLKPSRDVAFNVYAETLDGNPYDGLTADQRWRGSGFTEYLSPRGRWQRIKGTPIFKVTGEPLVYPRTEKLELPDFGPAAVMLDVRLTDKVGGPVFADPMTFRVGERIPAAIPHRSGFNYGVLAWDASLVLLQGRDPRLVRHYVQLSGRDANGLTPPSTFRLADEHDPELLAPFLGPVPQGVANYARRLMATYSASGALTAAVRKRLEANSMQPHADDFAAIAGAFNDHFSSGSFGYTLDLRRSDRTIDPIEDFLINTRQGHCERYASALVLMLRAVGIPCQFVTGYRGLEPLGNGRYVVRQEEAHAWAEVLQSRPAAQGREYYWQSYDPTPAFSGPLEETDANLIDSSTKQGRRILTDYILGLNPDTQRRIHEGIVEFVDDQWPWLVAGVAIPVAIFYAVRRRHRRADSIANAGDGIDAVPWYSRWMTQLAALGLSRQAAETPYEHADRLEKSMRNDPAMAATAAVPMQAARLLEQFRYAGHPASPDTIHEIQKRMAAFIESVKQQRALT